MRKKSGLRIAREARARLVMIGCKINELAQEAGLTDDYVRQVLNIPRVRKSDGLLFSHERIHDALRRLEKKAKRCGVA